MLSTGLVWFAGSAGMFIVWVFLVSVEQKIQHRLFLAGTRGWLDRVVALIGLRIARAWDHFIRYILQLGWYYGLHSILRTVLRTVVAFYGRIERVFEKNHKRTKQLRAEKEQVATDSHLTAMAQHKVDTALTPAQQKKLKETQLKGD